MLKNQVSAINFFLLITILIFLSVMTNNQTKWGILYEKFAMWAGDDDEQMINYEWSNLIVIYFCELIFRCCISVTFYLDLFSWMEKLTITFVKSNIKTPFLAFFVVLLLQIDIITVFREYIFANWTTIHKTRKKINAKFIFNKYF